MTTKAVAVLIAYILTIVAANVAIVLFGVVPIGFGLLAPAGVLFAGLAFTLRDAVQDTAGKRWSIAAVFVGALVSALLSPQLALASGCAFLVSELADLVVYTPLRERSWLGAIVASNTIGVLVDSVLFLSLAFGSLDFLAGQVVAKLEVTLLTVVLLAFWRLRTARTLQHEIVS